jgi:hypothetical protein
MRLQTQVFQVIRTPEIWRDESVHLEARGYHALDPVLLQDFLFNGSRNVSHDFLAVCRAQVSQGRLPCRATQ